MGFTNVITVKFKKLDPEAKCPTRATEFAAGWDLYSFIPEYHTVDLLPGERRKFDTRVCLEIPTGYEAQVRPRSGLALKNGVVCSFGTIDSDYRGSIGVTLFNHSFQSVRIEHGQRIAQLVIAPVVNVCFEEVEELSETDRGAKGYGSSGK
jgi:dUTP pyrophosphatase